MKRVVFAVPGSLDTPTGGYAYDRRIMAELRQLGWDVDCLDIGEGFPSPDEATRSAARSPSVEGTGRPADRGGRLGTGCPARRCGGSCKPASAARAGASSPRAGMGIVRRTSRCLASQRTGCPRRSARSRGDEPRNRKTCRFRLWRTGRAHHGGKARQRSCAEVCGEAETKCRICCPLALLCPAKDSTYSLPRSRHWLSFRGG